MTYAQYKFQHGIDALKDTNIRPSAWLASHYVYHILNIQVDAMPSSLQADSQHLRNNRHIALFISKGLRHQFPSTAMNDEDVEEIVRDIVKINEGFKRVSA
ncbi:hypothetical protein BH11PSE11_BH11PSE11_21350 [soil metagenome]